jgi:hypothetical protein
MQQEMIHRLIRVFAHTAPASQRHAFLFQVITRENPNPGRSPHKEGNPRGSLHTPNALPREASRRGGTQHMIERTRVKPTLPSWSPN